MRVWIDLTNSPHVLVMRPVIERLRADGHDVRVTARDFAQTIELCERLGIEHTAIGHHRGERLARQGRRPRLALGWRSCAGRAPSAACRGRRLRHRARPRLQRRDGRGRAAADPERDDVRLRVGDRPAQRQLPARARGGRARRDPAGSAWSATARAASCARYEGLKEEYYLADFEPDDAVLEELGLDPREPIVVVRTPPEVSLYHRFENDLFAQRAATPGAAAAEHGAQPVVLPRVAVPARGARARARASWSPSTRSTRSR